MFVITDPGWTELTVMFTPSSWAGSRTLGNGKRNTCLQYNSLEKSFEWNGIEQRSDLKATGKLVGVQNVRQFGLAVRLCFGITDERRA